MNILSNAEKDLVSVRKKDRIYVFLRIFTSLLLLSFIILKNIRNFIGIFDSILNLTSVFIILAIAAFLVELFLESLRWNILLRAQGARVNNGYLFVLFLIGNFYNNLLPSNIGGDFYRIYDVYKNKNIPVNQSISAVFMERFLGLISITIYFLVTSFSIYAILKKSIIIIAVFLGIAFILFSAVIKPNFFRIDKIFKKFKKLKKAEGKFYSFNEILNSYGRRIRYLYFGIMTNFAADLFVVLSYYLLSLSLGLHLNFMNFLFMIAAIFVFTGIPVSIGGLGVRENTIVFLLTRFGVSNNDAVIYSFLVLFMYIFIASLGGLVYLMKNIFYKSKTFI